LPISRAWILVACLTGVLAAGPVSAQHPQAIVDRAEEDFAAGRLEASVAGFDRLVTLDPSSAPWLWQRGIALYYLGRFEDCAAQFAAYRGENPRDVESAVWQFACVVRGGSIESADGLLERAGPDARVMRAEILAMFRGSLPPGALVERAAFVADVAQFYARFYAGLYCEVIGDADAAAAHLEVAASPRYRDVGGFMNAVAQVHWARVQAQHAGAALSVGSGVESRRSE
jgi:lipoprotein NlpI